MNFMIGNPENSIILGHPHLVVKRGLVGESMIHGIRCLRGDHGQQWPESQMWEQRLAD